MAHESNVPAGGAHSLGTMPEFALERFFDRFEFELPYQLGSSDPDTLSVANLLGFAAPDDRRRWEELRLGYRTCAGDPDLRAAIAALYPGRTPEDVVVATGGAEALLVAFAATVAPGDRVVAMAPAYQSLHEVPRAMGARLELVEIREDDSGGWRFPIDRLMDALRDDTDLLVLNVPHNPTGTSATAEELLAVVARCEQLGIRVVGDEVYRGLEWDGPTPPSVAELSDRAVAVGVTSKVYGLAGLRIGWLVTGDAALRRRVIAVKDYTTLCAAGPSETLATIAVRAHGPLLERTRALCRRNLGALEDFLVAHPGLIAWRRPSATTVAMAGIAPPLLARHGGEPGRVFAHWRERAGVLVVPGPVFGCAPDRFRLGFGRADLPRALAALTAAG
jgi:aspartate/methionine/tyrosine aminotransferase